MEELLAGGVQMTQTTQPRSWATLSEAGKDLTINKQEQEDNIGLFLTVCGNLNELYKKLAKLNHVMGKKITEHYSCQKGK